jgi:hypothetical protein
MVLKNIPLLVLHPVTKPLPLTVPKMWLPFYFQAKTLDNVDRGFISASITKTCRTPTDTHGVGVK